MLASGLVAEMERQIVGKASRSNKGHRTDRRLHAPFLRQPNVMPYCHHSRTLGPMDKTTIQIMTRPKTRKSGHGFAKAVSLEGVDGDGPVHIGKSVFYRSSQRVLIALDYADRLLPVVISFALSLGMGIAPKQELMINLACLAHPPQTSSVMAHSQAISEEYGLQNMVQDIWHGPAQISAKAAVSTTSQYVTADLDFDLYVPLSPADKWMLDVQRRMAADRKRWNTRPGIGGNHTEEGLPHGPVGGLPAGSDGADVPTRKNGSTGEPSGRPGSSHSRPDIGREGSRDEEAKPGEIDPRLCKKDPRVQAAAAKLMMSESVAFRSSDERAKSLR